MTDAKRHVRIRLIHEASPVALDGEKAAEFGLQDKKQAIQAQSSKHGASAWFECELDVKGSEEDGAPVFAGPFAHGSPKDRFLYISWKRKAGASAPWVQRIKAPLTDIKWSDVARAEKTGGFIQADICGRRPHATEAVTWKVVDR